MKKTGFTLAELLISLGIIGVIAAMTLPSLNKNTVEAQIGPKLAKAVSVFEQANTALLNAEGVDALSDTNINGNNITYINMLSNYMRGVSGGPTILTKDNIAYTVEHNLNANASSVNPHNVYCGYVIIDINGEAPPNAFAEDKFGFTISNAGSLRPFGGVDYMFNGAAAMADGGSEHWKTKCKNGETPSEPRLCAGSIFEQNLKVLYK